MAVRSYHWLRSSPGFFHSHVLGARNRFLQYHALRKSKAPPDKHLQQKKARAAELSCDQITALRSQEAKPILEHFGIWLQAHHPEVPPSSLLRKAIGYTLNQWDRLGVYLQAGFLKPDNNVAENPIRPFVLGRKNWLFAGAPKGAHASATFFSLIQNAKANNLELYSYLRHIFEKLPIAESEEDLRALLPNNFAQNHTDSTERSGVN